MKSKSNTRNRGLGLAFLVTALFSAPAAGAELEKFTFMFPTNSVTQYHPFQIAKERTDYVGYCSSVGTAVRPAYRGQGIATALKNSVTESLS